MTDKSYRAELTRRFRKNLQRFASLRQLIQQHVDQILVDPYSDAERLGYTVGGLDLRGCRSDRVTRSFRIIFVVCEECRDIAECQYCFFAKAFRTILSSS